MTTEITFSPELLMKIAPRATLNVALLADELNTAFAEYELRTPLRSAAIMAQIVHETKGLRELEEDLHYSAGRLAEVWSRFSETGERGGPPNELAKSIAMNPREISRVCYNGCHGRGLIQLSLRDNYIKASNVFGIDFVRDPDKLLDLGIAANVAAWFFRYGTPTDLALKADIGTTEAFNFISQRVNGGDIGKDGRLLLYRQCRRAFGLAE